MSILCSGNPAFYPFHISRFLRILRNFSTVSKYIRHARPRAAYTAETSPGSSGFHLGSSRSLLGHRAVCAVACRSLNTASSSLSPKVLRRRNLVCSSDNWTSSRFLSAASSRYYSSNQKSQSELESEKNVSSDAPVHPHLRPPRKLRQIIPSQTSPTDQGVLKPSQILSDSDQIRRSIEEPRALEDQRIGLLEKRWPVVSYSTAEEYRLEDLKKHLQSLKNGSAFGQQPRYELADSFLTEELVEDAVHYKLIPHRHLEQVGSSSQLEEQGDVFVFREGSVVFWNVAKQDTSFFLDILENFQIKPYRRSIVEHEAEYLDYSYSDLRDSKDHREARSLVSPTATVVNESELTEAVRERRRKRGRNLSRLTSDGKIILDRHAQLEDLLPLNVHGDHIESEEDSLGLVKYAFSDAIVLSVKLAIYESHLQEYVASIENVAEEIKNKGRILLSKDQVLRKTGELFFFRHSINLSSNFLDPPDFYWDREHLESLYRVMCAHLNISRRTKIINEKLDHCYALVELLRDHLNNQHHVRLELMIIALICVEVFFEMLHYAESYFTSPVPAPLAIVETQ